MHVKGQAIIASDPRGLKAWGLGYAVSSRGACHLRALPTAEYSATPEMAKRLWGTEEAADRFATAGKGRLVKWCEDVRVLSDALGLCRFITRTTFVFPEQLARLIPLVTTLQLTPGELSEAGERINNLERLFNVREGFSRKNDTLPERFLKEPLSKGPSKGKRRRSGADALRILRSPGLGPPDGLSHGREAAGSRVGKGNELPLPLMKRDGSGSMGRIRPG